MKTLNFRAPACPVLLLAFACMLAACKKDALYETPTPYDKTTAAAEARLVNLPDAAALEKAGADNCLASFIKREHITPVGGNVTELPDGFRIEDGGLNIRVGERELSLKQVSAEVRFCDEGALKSLSGKAAIPSPDDCLSFDELLRTDIGYFTGAYVNANFHLDFPLKPEQCYFVFFIGASLRVDICTNGDDPSVKPISIQAPGSSVKLLHILDFRDPFYFLEVEHELIGRLAIAESNKGQIRYTPLEAIPEMPTFDCRSYVSSDFTLFQVLNVKGDLYQNQSFLRQLAQPDPFDFPVLEGYKAGLNGAMSLGLPIADWTSFTIPLGQTSAALTAAPVGGKFVAKAFVNSRVQPDNSWWPDFIPVKPNAEMRVAGYVQQDGRFYVVLRGEMGIQKSAGNADLARVAGELRADNERLTLRGELDGPNDGWAVEADFGPEQSDFSVELPDNLLSNLSVEVETEVQHVIVRIDSISKLLSETEQDYAFELSLRGVKSAIPSMTASARKKIAAGAASARQQASKRIPKLNYCPPYPLTQIDNWIKRITDPYYDALNALDRAVAPTLDNESVRIELEKALRKLIGMRTLHAKTTIKAKTPGIFGCGTIGGFTIDVPISINVEALNSNEVNLLTNAANNIQFIQPAADRVFELRPILSRLPPREAMVDFQVRIKTGLEPVPNLDKVGFTIRKNPQEFRFFVELNGKRYPANFDPFDWGSILEAIIEIMQKD